jgi:hypothetical protein
VLLLALCSCAVTEGALLVDIASPDGGSDAAQPERPAGPRANMSLQYQISGRVDTQVDAELFVVDLFDTEPAQVAELHAAGRLVVAYVSAGSLESWREDAARFPRAAVGTPLSNYPNEAWLDLRSTDVRRLMEERFERALDKGFDGVFVSTLGAYKASSGFALTRGDELDYSIFLARAAHARGLSIGLSGNFELSAQLASEFDFAIAVGCIARGFCAELSPLALRAVPLFDLETEGDRQAVCSQAASFGIAVTFKRPSYDAFRSVCP